MKILNSTLQPLQTKINQILTKAGSQIASWIASINKVSMTSNLPDYASKLIKLTHYNAENNLSLSLKNNIKIIDTSEVKNGDDFVNLLRNLHGKVTLRETILIRNKLNTLKQAMHTNKKEEVTGSSMILRAFSETNFTRQDLIRLKELRVICNNHGEFLKANQSDEQLPLLQNDFAGLIVPACMNIAIHEVAKSLSSMSPLTYQDIHSKLNDKNNKNRYEFQDSPVGIKVQHRYEQLMAWFEDSAV